MSRTARAFAAGGMLALLAACSGGGSDNGAHPRATTTAPPSTTSSPPITTTEQADEAALRKLDEQWTQAVLRLHGAPNPDDPAFARYLTGDLLPATVAQYRQYQRDHTLGRLPAHSRYRSRVDKVSIHGAKATVASCLVDDGISYNATSGQILSDTVSTYQLERTASKTGDGWKFDDVTVIHKWNGVAGCAVTE